MIDFQGKDKTQGLFSYLSSLGILLYRRDNEWVSNASEPDVQSAVDSYTLSAAKDDVSKSVAAMAKLKRDLVVAAYSSGEMASWSIKDAEASAYVDEETAAEVCPMLHAEAQARQTTTAAIRARVIANAAAFRTLEAAISGRSGYLRDQVAVAADFDALNSIDISSGWPV